MIPRHVMLVGSLALFSAALPAIASPAEDTLRETADRYVEHHLAVNPLAAYSRGLPLARHDRFTANRLDTLEQFWARQDATLATLESLDSTELSPDGRVFRLKFLEWLAAAKAARICRKNLWNVDHMSGAANQLQRLVRYQPMDTAEERQQALERWADAAGYFDEEIVNLRKGLAQGYSAPKSVVERAAGQLETLASYATTEHPYYALAERTEDRGFREAFAALLETRLQPAMKRYTAFLKSEYLTQARTSRAITANPDGRACYMALYRRYTTLSRTPEEVHEIGLAAVTQNMETVKKLGADLFGTETFAAAVAAANSDPKGRIADKNAYHRFLEAMVERTRRLSAPVFTRMPTADLVVAPLPEFQQGTGVSPHYLAGNDSRPARFVYDPSSYDTTSYGDSEILAVHEGYPGHHLQVALALERDVYHPLEKMLSHSAYTEGWARYAEALAEELDVYQTRSALIQRRAWPARGMVLDTGLHVLGWSDEQLVEFLKASGRESFATHPEQMFDRMAVWPGQLTAYDSGALELFRLRALLREARGEDFNLQEFHELVLGDGVVPLEYLQLRVEAAARPAVQSATR